MPQISVKNQEQIQTFLEANEGVAVIEFYATSCKQCSTIAPWMQQKYESSGVPLIKIDANEAQGLFLAYQIQALPTLILICQSWDNVIIYKAGAEKENVDQVFKQAQHTKSLLNQ